MTDAISSVMIFYVNDNFSKDVNLVGALSVAPAILEVICQATGMGFAAIARVTDQRWIACAVRDEIGFGLVPGGELDIKTTICNEIREHRSMVVIDDVDSDPVYCDHHTPKLYGLKSYISVPIVLPDGSFFGSLCAISPLPAHVSQPKIVGMFKLFADMVSYHIEASQSLEFSKTALLNEQETSALREQFIAVLGHDLRSPLAGIEGGVRLLRKETLSDKGSMIVDLIEATTGRMGGLIANIMDFARGRLGGGITLNRSEGNIAHLVRQVVSELQTSHPDRIFITDIEAEVDVFGDHSRLGQVFSNLLGNALMHGDADQPVRARLRLDDGILIFQSINTGDPIPGSAMEQLFSPFSRGDLKENLQGLGLGLYISSQIAAAHDGSLTAESVGRETTFSFKMPVSSLKRTQEPKFRT